MKINYRLMEESDIEDIYNISKVSFKTPWSLDSISLELQNKFAKYIIAEDLSTKKVIGFVGVWIIAGEGNITNIAIEPNYRNLGIASKLLENLFTISKDNKCFDLTLEVRTSNLKAQNLYEKHGFINEGVRKRYYDDTGEDAIIMWKRDI